MNRLPLSLPRKTTSDIDALVEPLVGYISATHLPRATLVATLLILIEELLKTEAAAEAQVASFIRNADDQ